MDLAEVELVAGQEFINEPRANDSELLEVSIGKLKLFSFNFCLSYIFNGYVEESYI